MPSLISLFILTIFLSFVVRKMLQDNFSKREKQYMLLQAEQEKIMKQNSLLKDDNSKLELQASETVALYDITKEMCKTLDEEIIFNIFKGRINGFLDVSGFRFIKAGGNLSGYKNQTILPLNISKNPIGYLVASQVHKDDEDKFHILANQFLIAIKRALLYQKVQELTIIDTLTQVYSRRYFLERLNEEFNRSKKFKLKLSFVMLDLDHFKDINDKFGHLVGDAVLREIAKTIRNNIRQIDFMGRYGGEELSIVLTETDSGPALNACERIREAVELRRITAYDETLKTTISIGICTFPDDAKECQELIDNADKAMYSAKGQGRNRICVFRG